MLREISATGQRPGEPFKRWFSSAEMDLFAWFEQDQLVSFQLTYNKHRDEKALSWNLQQGLIHARVDEGATAGKYPASPLLLDDGEFNPDFLITALRRGAGELEPSLLQSIISLIDQHPSSTNA